MTCILTPTVIFFISLFSIVSPTCNSYAQTDSHYTIATLDLEANGVSEVVAKGLSEKIRTRISWLANNDSFVNNTESVKYSTIERSQMDKIFDQYEVQSTICSDVSCAIEFGKMLQVEPLAKLCVST